MTLSSEHSSRSLLMVQIFKSCSLKLSALFQHSLGFLSKHTSYVLHLRDGAETRILCLVYQTLCGLPGLAMSLPHGRDTSRDIISVFRSDKI